MGTVAKIVRNKVNIPAKLATQIDRMARAQQLTANRMLLKLIENGIEAESQREFVALADRLRNESDPAKARRLGDELGRMIFGG